jgi:hypothetical protein
VKLTLVDRGKATTPAPAEVLALHARGVTRLTRTERRGFRMASEQSSTRRAGVISKGWAREFEEPIPLPRRRQLVTLKDAGKYVTKLPKAEHEVWRLGH